MEVTFYEDPACSWCWAFQPVSTAFAFEFRDVLKARFVMGGLRDRPAADVDFIIQQWKKAEAVSGMPFDPGVWKKHALRTTFVACRAVKAAAVIDDQAARRYLRRLREAFYVEQIPIDDPETVLGLANEVGLDAEALRENVASGRAEALFARDRVEASQYGFGFPTVVLRNGNSDPPIVLQGAVPYADLLQALFSLGISPRQRRRFRDSKESWTTLFKIHRRLTLAEIQLVTGVEKSKLLSQLHAFGATQHGPFFQLSEKGKAPEAQPATPPVKEPAAAPPGSGESTARDGQKPGEASS
jgi:protein-disulfide isomerase-like protein with CxxC motif